MLPKIVLINPPSPFLINDRVFPNLGLLKIATSLADNGAEVSVLDLSGTEDYLYALSTHLKNNDAKVYGISATTPQMPYVQRIARHLREHVAGVKTVLGGAHPTLVNAAARKEKAESRRGRGVKAMRALLELVDVVIAGDGEKAVFAALDPDSPQLIDADRRNSPFFIQASDTLISSIPRRDFIDLASYSYSIEGKRATSLISQLGCPFNCGFCGGRNTAMLRGSRIRTVESVLEEIRLLYHAYGYTGFMFYDDELNVNPRFLELLQKLRNLQDSLGVEFALRGFVKSELFNARQAQAMHHAGFRWILSGFESGSPRILRNMRKTATIEDNTRCVSLAHEHGLKVKALMSIGHPGESLKSLYETADWVRCVHPDDLDVSIITAYPGSDYFDKAVPHPERSGHWMYSAQKSGDILYSIELDYFETSDYYKGIPGSGYEAYVYTEELEPADLVRLRDKIDCSLRDELGMAPPASSAQKDYEHSMGQTLSLKADPMIAVAC